MIKEKYFPVAAPKKNEGVETLNEHALEPVQEVMTDHDPLVAAALAVMNGLR